MSIICFNAVKCNLTELTTKKSWHSLGGQRLLAVNAYTEHHIVVAFKLVRLSFSAPPPSPLVSPFPLLTQCDGCPDYRVWGLMAGLLGLPAMGACYCLGAGWSQWRPLGLPKQRDSTQLDAVIHIVINQLVTEMLNLPLSFFMLLTLKNILTVK